MPSPGQNRSSHNSRQPPRRLSLVDLRAAERSEGTPAIDSGFVYSDGHPRTLDSPSRSPSCVSGTRSNALHSPLLASPSYRPSRSPTFPSTPVSPAPSYSARRSTSIQQLAARASRQAPSAAGSESISTDNHESGDDHAGRSSFAYTRSTSWYSNAPLSHTASSYAEETQTSPPAMLSPSTSHGSLRGVGRRFPYTHTRGKSDSTGSRSPMTKTSVWTSSPATSTTNVEFMEPSGSREDPTVIRRQISRGPGMSISRSSGSLRTAMLAYKTPEIDGKQASGILETENTNSPDDQYTSALTSVAASPEALQCERSPAFEPAKEQHLSRSRSGRNTNAPPRYGVSSYSSWSEVGPTSAEGTSNSGEWHHPDVPRSPSSTPTSQMVRLDSFATGRESLTTEPGFRYDEPLQSASDQISPTGWHASVENHPPLETLVEDVSVLSEAGGMTIRNPSNIRDANSGSGRQASLSEQRPQSASSSSSATSVPMGFGQSLRNYFADYLMYPTLTRAQTSSVDVGTVDEQEWLSQPSRSTPSETSTGGNGRASSRGTTGADQIDRAVNDSDELESWRRHQGSSSLASGILPFPTDAIPEEDNGQRIHRADREYLSALASPATAQSNRASLKIGSLSDTNRAVKSSVRRQRSSDPLLPASRFVSEEYPAEILPMPNARARNKRWSDVVLGAISPTQALFSDEPPIGKSAQLHGRNKGTLPGSGRSSGASRHSMQRLVAGPANRRFKRLSAEIDTRDDSPPLSFFGRLQDRSLQPSPSPRGTEEKKRVNELEPLPSKKTQQQSSGRQAVEPSSTIDLERLASHEHHHRLTSETLRHTGPDSLPPVKHGVSPLAMTKQMRLDLYEQRPRSGLLRVMSRSKPLRVLCSSLCPALLIIVPACWYVFEGGYLYYALSPAVLFPPIVPLVGAWTSYLGIWLVDPGYVTPAGPQDVEQQPSTEEDRPTRTEQGEEEDPAIAALDKDSPKRKLALERLREQLLKAVASPVETNERPQSGQQTDLEAAQALAVADASDAVRATPHHDAAANEPQTPTRRYPSIATTHLSCAAGPSAPPTSPVTVRPSKRSLRLAQDSQMTLRQQSHPELKSMSNLPTGGVNDLGKPRSSEALVGQGSTRPVAPERQLQALDGPSLEDSLLSLWPPNARGLTRRIVHLNDRGQSSQDLSVAWCAECKLFPPPRSVHVQSAGRCVEGFQYFSYAIGRSIGQGNVVFLVALLFFSAIFLLYVLGLSVWMLATLSHWDSHHDTNPPGILFTDGPYNSFQDALQAAPFAAILFLASAIMLVACLIPYLARQSYTSSQAQTFPQRRLAKAIRRKLRAEKCQESFIKEAIHNPFDTGSWYQNLRQEMWSPSHACHYRFRRPVRTSAATLHEGRDEEAALSGRHNTSGSSAQS